MKRVVVIGGGTGSFTVLRGLKKYEQNLTISAIVTMADDGGSNKVLRDEFGLLPTSGIRQCMVALAPDEGLMRELFNYRYHQGTGIAGMTFGNLFMAAVADIVGSQKKAIEETCKILGVKGTILPVSYENTSLLAKYEDGTEILGEHYIDISSPRVRKQRIASLRTIPQAEASVEVLSEIKQADLIVLGPGDLYTNTVANLVVGGVGRAIEKSHAKVVFVMNLMTRPGETYNYTAGDFLDDMGKYLDKSRVDVVVVNNDFRIDPELLTLYRQEDSVPVLDNLGEKWGKAKLVRAPLLSHTMPEKQKGDTTERSMVRHDSDQLAKILVNSIE